MKKNSAGLLMYKKKNDEFLVFLVHPGGPYWYNKYQWGIPKGEIEKEEDPQKAAIREFEEETSIDVNSSLKYLGITSSKYKTIETWAFEKDWEGEIKSNLFEMEWPKNSGIMQEFPENDKGRWFSLDQAEQVIFDSQKEILLNFKKEFEI